MNNKKNNNDDDDDSLFAAAFASAFYDLLNQFPNARTTSSLSIYLSLPSFLLIIFH